MCRCTPEMRTPFCGKPGCEMPPQKVVPITGTTLPRRLGEPRQALIECLEDALARARSGELQSFIGTGFTSDNMRYHLYCDWHENTFQMLGALAALEHEYYTRVSRENGQLL